MLLYHFMKAKHALEAIERRRVKTSDFAGVNDPFEFLSEAFGNYEEEEQRLEWRDGTAKRIGLICFSEIYSEPLLWGHYADRCKGICLGFDFDKDATMIRKVRYCRKRTGVDDSLHDHLATKSHNWAYEREWRAFTKLYESPEPDPVTGLHYCSIPSRGQMVLREILIGLNCAEENIADRLIYLTRDYDPRPEIFYTRRSLSSFEIEKFPV